MIIHFIFFFLDFDYVILEDTGYLDGIALFYGYFLGLIVFVYAVYLTIKKHKNIKTRRNKQNKNRRNSRYD